MQRGNHITILGGGPAGLAIGYFARKRNLPFAIFEAGDRAGGNAITFEHRGFRFDSGAHRFHDKDPAATAELERLLGDELVRIDVPSQIYHRGRFIDFPLSPLNLLTGLGVGSSARAALSFVKARLTGSNHDGSFGRIVVARYGREIAGRFLLDYSEKLWGLPPERLSPAVSGKRLNGLTFRTFLTEMLAGKKAKTQHLDGSFLYPRQGYGRIVERLAEACGKPSLHLGSPVTRLRHDGRRILAVEVDRHGSVEPDRVVSTLPLGTIVRLLDPAAPPAIRETARQLRSRNLVLVAFFLERERITRNGSVYFPDPEFPMTRAYEPNNRSPLMSPPGRTSVVVEIPCDADGPPWTSSDDDVVRLVRPHLERIGWIDFETTLGTRVERLPHAYPVLELGIEQKVDEILEYLDRFENLHLSGRNGRHVYAHVHDMMRFGKDVVERIASSGVRTGRTVPLVS